ncbi:hypothetical protein BI041_gp46 [Propionibacterium phage PFR2]|uniref:Uncharacterized protein n=2 Tax=Pulverervirus PFR1 TaxID=2170091 RepID=A0A173GA05_9CAUD|nr:hypothetical protein [Propionibacterium freudenreichii]YP_009287720.1 hypothetical protein BI042_gp44 [Propionibacterium phage PFR1]YP_009290953.1 hypothetical protein BI041_gp46 [Propionibacterium phage PFR2]ANH49910.1 hypothetical protein PFR_44 [Propionibacterium phage PFR1]ANH49969.1 hypothetical protein PFR2_44 [Propionibacterium phage PFR2]MDK9674419.1 hypothetical protein [Propionibacterium freudenreichii]CEI46727.1 Protein of unknown function [Propionibacterium freudenreichii]SCQ4
MRIISPVTVELTDAELVTIQRALERWSGMDDELAQLIGAVAETGSTFTLATNATPAQEGRMNTLPPDALEWDAEDIRSVCHALWQTAYIYRRVKVPDPTTADAVRLLRRWKANADHLDKLLHGLEGLQRQQVQPRIKLTTEDA